MAKILRGNHFESKLEDLTLGEFYFNCAGKYPEKIAQIDGDQETTETYFSLKQRSVRVAIQLKKMGIKSDDIVATCSYNSLDITVALIAATYLGAKIANLHPTLSARNTTHLLTLTFPKLIFVEESSLDLIVGSLSSANCKSDIVVLGSSDKFTKFSDLVRPDPEEETFRPIKVDVRDTAILFFSSGTTGLPKAICVSHYGFIKQIELTTFHSDIYASTLHSTTFYWISGMAILSGSFLAGGTRVFCHTVNGEATFKMIEKHKLTYIFMAPIQTYQLTNVKNPERYDVSSLRQLFIAGTPISVEQFKRLGQLLKNTAVVFGYAMSEVGVMSTFDPKTDKELIRTKVGSCGKVSPFIELKVVNPDTEEILGPNQNGEIRVKSPTLMRGYYNQDSSSCFDPDGFLKTGDLGFYDEDECVYVVGRLKEMFKYMSWHIVPSSIEAVLLEHPAVRECAVFGIPREEEGEIPAACVVLKENAKTDKEEIEEFIEKRVSDREKLRGGIIFVDRLPRTPTGKLLRAEVRKSVMDSL